MTEFEHIRHKPSEPLARPHELIVACAPLRSNINLSRIVRAAGCFGIERIVVTGPARIDRSIARDGADQVLIESHRSLAPTLKKLRSEGYQLIGLEQTTNSQCLYDFSFPEKSCLVVGNERQGLTEDLLELLDQVVEIPVHGLPHSHNVASATIMAMYEYCRQIHSTHKQSS